MFSEMSQFTRSFALHIALCTRARRYVPGYSLGFQRARMTRNYAYVVNFMSVGIVLDFSRVTSDEWTEEAGNFYTLHHTRAYSRQSQVRSCPLFPLSESVDAPHVRPPRYRHYTLPCYLPCRGAQWYQCLPLIQISWTRTSTTYFVRQRSKAKRHPRSTAGYVQYSS